MDAEAELIFGLRKMRTNPLAGSSEAEDDGEKDIGALGSAC